MIRYGSRQLADAFRAARSHTIAIAQDIPEEHYGFRAVAGTRSIAELLVHVWASPSWQLEVHGQGMTNLESFDYVSRVVKIQAEETRPRSKAQIIALLREGGDEFASFLEQLTETRLAETVKMTSRAEAPTRFEMLLSVKEHEIHHRGQLMVLQRMIGIVPHLTREMEARFPQAAGPRPAAT
jgi:uncharacterized damage-inducible protein DinB